MYWYYSTVFKEFVIIICKLAFNVLAWKQIGYKIGGVQYKNSTDYEYKPDAIHFHDELEDSEKFFIQNNNVPIGFEVYGDRVFITVPRRRYGIPSTLNYVELKRGGSSPLLKPYPDDESIKKFVSVYRPRVDACHRLWMVDTGHLEVPGVRKQIQPPAIIIFDLRTNKEILRHELDPSVIVNERTSAGLTSIAVDVDPKACSDAFAYINDLATEGVVVFSLKTKESWRMSHPSFVHEEQAMNFTAAGHVITWRDGIFSIALSSPDDEGKRTAYYHPLVSTKEFAVDTAVLKNKGDLEGHVKLVGDRGANSQSGSHDVHHDTGVMFFANVAQDAILCWNVKDELSPETVAIASQDSEKLAYVSDLKVSGDELWVLTNQIPRFIFNTQHQDKDNFFIQRYKIHELIRGTPCEKSMKKNY
ncbi:L-dopachrome tautomerase yellow-f-like [Ostrinia nubilalis]|uniref:L-dopachrome tautomerase yellow-f-like n=1 Tax=Ostrinia nubilalis TaxID=29057 RepID=UPI0030823DC5